MKKLANLIVFLISLFSVIIFAGRNHFLLGSALGFGKWILLFLLLWIVWRRRKTIHRRINILLIAALSLIGFEVSLTNFQEINLHFAPEAKKEVSIITYNLFFKNRYPDNIINEIKAEDADILTLQEVTPTWKKHLQKIAKKYPYRKEYLHKRTKGLAIYSKYPIKSHEFFYFNDKRPIGQIAEIEVGEKRLIINNIHLASPAIAVENPDQFLPLYIQNYNERNAQMKKLRQVLEKKYPDSPKIIAGDLNTMRMEPIYRDLTYYYFDLFQQCGNGMQQNFPNTTKFDFPLITLDYILFRGNIKPVSAKVLPGSSSDHLAVKGIIKI